MIEQLALKLPPSQLEALKAIADAEGVGLSEYVRQLIERDIERHRVRFHHLAAIFGREGGFVKDE